MRLIFFLLFVALLSSIYSQAIIVDSRKEILKVLEEQRIAWNKGDLESYMQGYWKSDSLRFIGKRGIMYGWTATLDGYKKSYPGKEVMGELTFKVISLEILSQDCAFMIGEWALERSKNNVTGFFSLIWRKIKGNWVIVTDHSS